MHVRFQESKLAAAIEAFAVERMSHKLFVHDASGNSICELYFSTSPRGLSPQCFHHSRWQNIASHHTPV